MRSPEERQAVPSRAGKNYEDDLHLRYLSPGAFTVLPPNEDLPPDPPLAPNPYRLTPTLRRHKHQSFAIIGEVNGSRPGSRSSSPTGRVSPFRGHGFNPTGSRHASPVPSPPPEDVRISPTHQSPSHTKIPKYARYGSAGAFGDKVSHIQSPPSRRRFNSKLSQSLTNLEAKRVINRPPQAPRKHSSNGRLSAIQQLSPIAGSSPEPSQSLSSPSRIPKSRSQPPSRITSPTRSSSSLAGRPPRPTRTTKTSGSPSASTSRDTSPSKVPTSPTKIPVKKYKHVQAKVNSKNNSKSQVPPKSQVQSDQTTDSDAPNNVNKPKLTKRESVSRLRTQSKLHLLTKTGHSNNNSNTNTLTNKNKNNKIVTASKSSVNTNNTKNVKKVGVDNNKITSDVNQNRTNESIETNNQITSSESETKLKSPTTTTVVSSTTTTATKPLKIEAKMEQPTQFDTPKPVSPMVDGRVLSAKSVSNAMNRMNESVPNSETLKDHGFAKFSPAAHAVMSVGGNSSKSNPALDTKNATKELPSVQPLTAMTNNNNNNTNHVTHTGLMDSKMLEMEVQNNLSKLISPEHIENSVQKSIHDRIKDAGDVQPIKITVQENPSNIEVQSGNVRIPVSATNGVNERAGIPPSNHSPPNEPDNNAPDPAKSNVCTRFLSSCKNKMSNCCKCCKKEPKEMNNDFQEVEDGSKSGCFSCCGKKKKPDQIRINIEEDEPKKTCLERLKCCGKNRVGDTTGCFSSGKRKDSWAERRDSILSDPPPPRPKCSKDCCKDVLRKIFCINLCCKKKVIEVPVSRKTSTISSKKKSLTPLSQAPPPEDTRSKLDLSLVEHMSHMRGAIPVLPICLAWFCLVMNCIGPGTGTVFSGLFCLCVGKPRFSQIDGAKQRIGAFIIDLIIGFGQFFTVLFCLVGWGWSIWWGVIMLKIAKKYKKLKQLEALEEANPSNDETPKPNPNQAKRDPERGS